MTEDREGLEALTRALLGIANGRFDARAPRTYRGDAADVLAFLVNATAEEVKVLFEELEAEREELRRTQSRLAQAEKMAALGRLAAGVAHQMNQPLTVISALVDLIAMDPERPVGDQAASLEMVTEATRQLSVIVDSVRTFGRGGASNRLRIPAAEPVLSAHKLFAAELDRLGVGLAWDLAPSLPSISADLDQLRQAFVNLLANARDAVRMDREAAPPPRMKISISADSKTVQYCLEDNGPGVPAEHITQLFEPFFTTKGLGSGTGLGLSVALGIVEQHGGRIEYQPADLGGACFIVRIPRAEDFA